MTTTITNGTAVVDPASGFSDVEFGVSAQGFPVARIGDSVLAMVPGRSGATLAHAWREKRPLTELKREDFYCFETALADEAAFRTHVFETAEYKRELRQLNRKEINSDEYTRWGRSQHAKLYTEGIVRHYTSSHGGFVLSPERNAQIHPMLRDSGRSYEEDCHWSAVALAFPRLFTSYEKKSAERCIKDHWPDAWEKIAGTVLGPGESHEKDRRAFAAAHANDWVVISAITSRHEKGFVEVVATPGGKREGVREERRFLVPAVEYEIGQFGFVIDVSRHRVYGGPSSFVGWNG